MAWNIKTAPRDELEKGKFRGDLDSVATAVVNPDGTDISAIANSLVPAVYDYIALSYTGDNLTSVVFKTGGSGGTTVSTLTLAYTGSVLDSVTKT